MENPQLLKAMNDAFTESQDRTGHVPGVEGFNFSPEMRSRITQERLLRANIQKLVDEFNSHREDPEEIRIHVSNGLGACDIIAGRNQDDTPRSSSLLSKRQMVMNEFAAFLKGKFFQRV